MPSERKRRTGIVRRDIVRLIVTTRERFPHTPRLTSALRRIMWRYVAQPPAPNAPPATRRKRRARSEQAA